MAEPTTGHVKGQLLGLIVPDFTTSYFGPEPGFDVIWCDEIRRVSFLDTALFFLQFTAL